MTSAIAQLRYRAAFLALGATIGLTAFKLLVAFLSGSVGVFSEGVHSFLDVVSAGLAYFTVQEAGKPADEEHPFGHGKIETLSSLFESLLLVLAAGLIVFEGIHHLRHPHPLKYESLAIATIFGSMVVSFLMYRHNSDAARKTESSAIRVNALHFLSDVVASLGVLIGLIAIKVTGWLFLDPMLAFLVAAYILVISASQAVEALRELSDSQLPDTEVETIRTMLKGYDGQIIEAHDLRTRKSGATRHIDFHLVVCGHMSVHESHTVCDDMESRITERFPSASVNIHVEPCEHQETNCHVSCPHFEKLGKRKE